MDFERALKTLRRCFKESEDDRKAAVAEVTEAAELYAKKCLQVEELEREVKDGRIE